MSLKVLREFSGSSSSVRERTIVPVKDVQSSPFSNRGEIVIDSQSGFYYSDGTQWISPSEAAATSVNISDSSGPSGSASLIVDAQGPNLGLKKLTQGANIVLTQNGSDIMISGVAGPSSNLVDQGPGASLISSGTGPVLGVRKIIGSGIVSVTENANDITVNVPTTTITDSGSGVSLISSGTGPTLGVRKIIGAGGLTVTQNANDITLTGQSITATDSGTGSSLVLTGSGPGLVFRKVSGSSTINTTTSSTDLQLSVNSSAVAGQPLISSGTIGADATYGALALDNTNATSGVLLLTKGGTGTSVAPLESQVLVATSPTATIWSASRLKKSVKAATTDILRNSGLSATPVYSPSGGSSGRGTIAGTLSVSGTFVVDGVTMTNGDRLLLKNEGDLSGLGNAANGVYTVTISGTALTLTRSTDFDADGKVASNTEIFVDQGTTNSTSGVVLTNVNPVIGGGGGSPLNFLTFRELASTSPYDIVFWGLNSDESTLYRVTDRKGRILKNANFSTLLAIVRDTWIPRYYPKGTHVKFTAGTYYFDTRVTFGTSGNTNTVYNNMHWDLGGGVFTPMLPDIAMFHPYSVVNITITGGTFKSDGTLYPNTVLSTTSITGNTIVSALSSVFFFHFCQKVKVLNQNWDLINGINVVDSSDMVFDGIFGNYCRGMIALGSINLSERIIVSNLIGVNQLDDTVQFGIAGNPPGATHFHKDYIFIGCKHSSPAISDVPADYVTYGGSQLMKLGDPGCVVSNVLVSNCIGSGVSTGRGIYVRGAHTGLTIKDCSFYNYANTDPTGVVGAIVSPYGIGCIDFSQSTQVGLVVSNNHFDNVGVPILLGAGNSGTFIGNTSATRPPPLRNPANWNMDIISTTTYGGRIPDTVVQSGNFSFTPGQIKCSTTTFGSYNSLYVNTLANRVSVNAPKSLTQQACEFSVASIDRSPEMVDQTASANTGTIGRTILIQGFRPKTTGLWTYTTILMAPATNAPFVLTLKAYLGINASGTLLQQEDFNFAGHTLPVTQKLMRWTTPLAIAEETQYAFSVETNPSTTFSYAVSNYLTYPYGRGGGSPSSNQTPANFSIGMIPTDLGRRQIQTVSGTKSSSGSGTITSEIRTETDDKIAAICSTTSATPTTMLSYDLSGRVGEMMQLSISVSGRRTGGTAGTANDGIVVGFANGAIQNKSGVVLLSAPTKTIIVRDQVSWDVEVSLVGTSLTVIVTGSTDNNIDWKMSLEMKTPAAVTLV